MYSCSVLNDGENVMKTEMWVMTHKIYPGVTDKIYRTIHVGHALTGDLQDDSPMNEIEYVPDDTGDNISTKNKSFCELTGLYWLWKNHTCDIIGVCHYRRFFLQNNRMLTKEYIEKTLEEYDIIIPSNLYANGDSTRNQYALNHIIDDFDICGEIIREKYPEYTQAFDVMQNCPLMNCYNMLIARKEVFDEYCSWLFDILFEVEKRNDLTGRDTQQQRVFGYLSERLLKVWLLKQNLRVKEQVVKLMSSDEIEKHFKVVSLKHEIFVKITKNLVEKYKSHEQKLLDPIDESVAADGKIPVWMCWWQGENNAPDVVKMCMSSVRRNLDNKVFTLRVITLDNCMQYVSFSPQIIEKFNEGQISMAMLSDILRMELLYRYGGLWIDATYYVSDTRINDIADAKFYTQKMKNDIWDDDVSKCRWSGDFLKGDAGFSMFGFVMEAFSELYLYTDKIVDCFAIDHFVDIAYENLEEVKAAIDSCHVNNEQVRFLVQNSDRNFCKETWDEVCKETWIHKLSYKNQYISKNIVGKQTYYGHICAANKFAFIICTNDEIYENESRKYIDSLVVPKGYDVDVIMVKDASSMTSGYNYGLDQTNAKYKIYMHHDVFIVNKNFLADILKIFKDETIGMIGMVGTPKLPSSLCPWEAPRVGALHSNIIQKSQTTIFDDDIDEINTRCTQTGEIEIKDVECIDGLCMVTQYDLLWREDIFKAWDFYDVSQSFEYRKAGYRVVVPSVKKPWVLHDDGVLNLSNYEHEKEIFRREYISSERKF